MSTPTVNFSGLASGIDTSSIIASLTAVAQKPITLLQGKDDTYNSELAAWQQFNTNLSSLQSAVATLGEPSTFTTASATSSDTTVATVTTLPGATLGDHSLSVTQLAQAQKVVSTPVSSGSTALGKTGSFTLNGKTISVSSTDALTDVAVKINAAQAGVSATVVNVGPGDFRLTLTSNQTGTANTIAAADVTGGVLGSLGILGSGAAGCSPGVSASRRMQAAYTGAASLTLLQRHAVGRLPAGNFLRPGGERHVSSFPTAEPARAMKRTSAINLNTASLTDVANAINQAGVSRASPPKSSLCLMLTATWAAFTSWRLSTKAPLRRH